MNIDEVIVIFLKLAELSDSESGNYQNLCENAVRSLRARLKSDVNEEECGDSLNRAAAALAFIRYVQRNIANGESGGFKVGEISVSSTNEDSMKYAASVWEDALLEVRDFLYDDGFIFGRIL